MRLRLWPCSRRPGVLTDTAVQDNLQQVARSFQRTLAEARLPSMRLMEVCGTHSHAIGRSGLRSLLPPGMELLSGPGCPVCVTPPGEIDAVIELARRDGVTLCTFGDMMRVPGSTTADPIPTNLAQEKARGASIEVIYSPLQAVTIAGCQPEREVILIAVGFETTAPAVAAAVLEAARHGLHNFSVLSLHKLVPPALAALLQSGEVRLDGLLCPGHVSTIIGSDAYHGLCRKHRLPCVIAGFEVTDIMAALLRLARQVHSGQALVENAYSRAVRPQGNIKALAVMDAVFAPADAVWRGLGEITDSGLRLRDQYRQHDAVARHGLEIAHTTEPPECCCGAVLRGVMAPNQCPSFGSTCTPQMPVGPCMVSSEGSCAASWRYGAYREEGHDA